eukprot:3445724-Pyramimonas_sp.AAC.1
MGKDRALRLWLHSADPIVQATRTPMGKWATVVWDSGADYAKLEAGWRRVVRRAAARQAPHRKFDWAQVRGPATALYGSRDRLGWTRPAPHIIMTHRQEQLNMRIVPPSTIKALALARLEQVAMEEWAEKHELPG